ncbi:MAG TPA: hypothetical protein VE783_11605 [Candidatus Limnocylindrales bacterium]|nr:hypothetical protein [Candidatus Limnocylindrales bacterium]
MESNNENRVLMRMGARNLSENETDQVTGGLIPTLLSVIFTNGGTDHSLDS